MATFLKSTTTLTKEEIQEKAVIEQYITLEGAFFATAYIETFYKDEELIRKQMWFEYPAGLDVAQQVMKEQKVNNKGTVINTKYDYEHTKTPYALPVSDKDTVERFENWLNSSVNTIL